MGIVENDTKVAKREKNFNIPTTTLTTVSKNKDKMIYFFLLSEYTRKHDTASDNPHQRTLLTLDRLWH